MQEKILQLLQQQYPTVASASTELINLSAILEIPKGTEYFISDIHGEYDAFNHYLKNASGIILEKIKVVFPNYNQKEQSRLAFFVYYPTDMLNKYDNALDEEALGKLQRQMLFDMVTLAKLFASKYTKSKVRKYMPDAFMYVMQELLYESQMIEDKDQYYQAILNAVFTTQQQNNLIMEMSRLIRNLAIDHLHVVGDIFDRGPFPHLVMEKLLRLKNVDVQWGNHDIIWMGAASGCPVSIANVIRIAARYNNLDCLEDGYGINLRPLAMFAVATYQDDPCDSFMPSGNEEEKVYSQRDLVAKIHKAISIIQFKVEAAVIQRRPEFELEHRLLLDKINSSNATITINGKSYKLKDTSFASVDPANPFALSEEEARVIAHLEQNFLSNELLQQHIRWMFDKGSMVLPFNQSLLFHAAVPLTEEGDFLSHTFERKSYAGASLFRFLEQKIRIAYQNRHKKDVPERDYFVFLWQGKASPLFAKHQMTTFERYFIADKSTHLEIMNPYFRLREEPETVAKILAEFGMGSTCKIINGHVPLDVTQGEPAVVSNDQVILIDGGMSKQFASRTSIGGYTLIADSYAYFLVSHERFSSHMSLIDSEEDIISVTRYQELSNRRQYVYDTDIGRKLQQTILDLQALIQAYRDGIIKEK